ncbi:MAG TPA: GGDEF domain-containing protein [Chloroflexota bacterium]|jgi:diguanylate cyclase (GGDEF)-like protein
MSLDDPDELRRRLRQMTALQAATTRILSALDPEAVLSGVLDSLPELLAHHTAEVRLDNVPFAQQTVTRTLPSGLVEALVPLVSRGRSVGVLQITLGAPLDDSDREIVEQLAATAAAALQNAYLYQETQRLATTDPLTGLSNYRHFHELLDLEIQRARRMRYAVGLLAIDLDHFKQINDRHGHPAGDRALQCVAEVLRSSLRRTDIVGRVGGEEFAVALPGDGLEQVAVVGEKLRRTVEVLPPVAGGSTSDLTPVTLSIGGASLLPDDLDKQALISSADEALYEAKRSGRNRVRLSRQLE